MNISEQTLTIDEQLSSLAFFNQSIETLSEDQRSELFSQGTIALTTKRHYYGTLSNGFHLYCSKSAKSLFVGECHRLFYLLDLPAGRVILLGSFAIKQNEHNVPQHLKKILPIIEILQQHGLEHKLPPLINAGTSVLIEAPCEFSDFDNLNLLFTDDNHTFHSLANLKRLLPLWFTLWNKIQQQNTDVPLELYNKALDYFVSIINAPNIQLSLFKENKLLKATLRFSGSKEYIIVLGPLTMNLLIFVEKLVFSIEDKVQQDQCKREQFQIWLVLSLGLLPHYFIDLILQQPTTIPADVVIIFFENVISAVNTGEIGYPHLLNAMDWAHQHSLLSTLNPSNVDKIFKLIVRNANFQSLLSQEEIQQQTLLWQQYLQQLLPIASLNAVVLLINPDNAFLNAALIITIFNQRNGAHTYNLLDKILQWINYHLSDINEIKSLCDQLARAISAEPSRDNLASIEELLPYHTKLIAKTELGRLIREKSSIDAPRTPFKSKEDMRATVSISAPDINFEESITNYIKKINPLLQQGSFANKIANETKIHQHLTALLSLLEKLGRYVSKGLYQFKKKEDLNCFIIRMITEKPFNCNTRTLNLFELAARCGHIKLLLLVGDFVQHHYATNPDYLASTCSEALWHSITFNRASAIEILLTRYHFNPNQEKVFPSNSSNPSFSYSLLYLACLPILLPQKKPQATQKSNVKMAIYLIDAGANIYQTIPLFYSSVYSDYLIDAGILHLACYYGYLELAKLLLGRGLHSELHRNITLEQAGTKVSCLDLVGVETTCCTSSDIKQLREFLLRQGAKHHYGISEASIKKTILNNKIHHTYTHNEDPIFNRLVSYIQKYPCEDEEGKSTSISKITEQINKVPYYLNRKMHYSNVQRNSIVQPLIIWLAQHFPINKLNAILTEHNDINLNVYREIYHENNLLYKVPLLQLLVMENKFDIASLLLQYNADPNFGKSNVPYLYILCNVRIPQEQVIPWFSLFNSYLSSEMTKKNKHGYSVLHQATEYGCEELLGFLLENISIDINDFTNDGYTALHIAVMNQFWHLIPLFIRYKANFSQPTKQNESLSTLAKECSEYARRYIASCAVAAMRNTDIPFPSDNLSREGFQLANLKREEAYQYTGPSGSLNLG